MEVSKIYKVTVGWARIGLVEHNQTSLIVEAVLDYFCARRSNLVGRAMERNSKGCGFESHVSLTLCLEPKNLSAVINIMYHFTHLFYDANH